MLMIIHNSLIPQFEAPDFSVMVAEAPVDSPDEPLALGSPWQGIELGRNGKTFHDPYQKPELDMSASFSASDAALFLSPYAVATVVVFKCDLKPNYNIFQHPQAPAA